MNVTVPVTLLVVKLYVSAGLPATELHAAGTEARAILRDAGLELRWIDCSSRAGGGRGPLGTRCRSPLAGNEVLVRIVASGPPAVAQDVAMGSSMVDERSPAPPVLATVFRDRVWQVARGAGVDGGRLLGRAMAHEIGHLLLNHPRHADRGLMRARWSHVELWSDAPDDWAIPEEQAKQMRAAIAARG